MTLINSVLRAALYSCLLPCIGCSGKMSGHSDDLHSPDPAIRIAAIDHLSGKEAVAAAPALIECLADGDPLVRHHSILALNRIGHPVFPLLFEACRNANLRMRSGAIQALGWPNPLRPRAFQRKDDEEAFPLLTDALESSNVEVRRSAAEVLWVISIGAGRGASALPSLKKAIQDSEPAVRYQAATSIGMLAKESPDRRSFASTSTELAHLLSDPDHEVRRKAAWALGQIGIIAVGATPQLVKATRDSDNVVRIEASESLIALDPTGKRAAPLLIIAYRDETDQDIRLNILTTLRRFPSLDPALTLPILVRAIDNESTSIRELAIIILGEMGRSAALATTPLHKAMEEGSARVRLLAAWALYHIEGKKDGTTIVIQNGLSSKEPRIRQQAAELLGSIGNPANTAVPTLERVAIGDPDEQVRGAASAALRNITKNKE